MGGSDVEAAGVEAADELDTSEDEDEGVDRDVGGPLELVTVLLVEELSPGGRLVGVELGILESWPVSVGSIPVLGCAITVVEAEPDSGAGDTGAGESGAVVCGAVDSEVDGVVARVSVVREVVSVVEVREVGGGLEVGDVTGVLDV